MHPVHACRWLRCGEGGGEIETTTWNSTLGRLQGRGMQATTWGGALTWANTAQMLAQVGWECSREILSLVDSSEERYSARGCVGLSHSDLHSLTIRFKKEKEQKKD